MSFAVIHERDDVGRVREVLLSEGSVKTSISSRKPSQGTHALRSSYLVDLATKMFLPAGYPNTVSPGIISGEPAMPFEPTQLPDPECPAGVLQLPSEFIVLKSNTAGCVESMNHPGVLDLIMDRLGFGVGNPDATPTQAMLLSVLQDACGRLATILSALVIGSSLYPEAKTYRLLADVLNDTAVVIDTLSPILIPFPVLRIGSLCVSAVFKALCGISAGGSKAAITLHFATPLSGKGDVGDLNAKDASKETVLALFGMLLGTLIVPYLKTSFATYTAMCILIGLHLGINYLGVRGLVLRSLNRARLAMAWLSYRQSDNVPTPSQIANLERIFDQSGMIRHPRTGHALGKCTIGSSVAKVLREPIPQDVLNLFSQDRFIIWFDHRCLHRKDIPKVVELRGFICLHIFLKEGYSADDQLRAWIYAVEICNTISNRQPGELEALAVLRDVYDNLSTRQKKFLDKMQAAGWNVTDSAILAGSPSAVITEVSIDDRAEEKKAR